MSIVTTHKLPTGCLEARLGELTVVVNADGYIDATLLCKSGGKLFGNWRNNKRTSDFLDCLSTTIGIPIVALVRLSTNEANGERHTWVHPKVAVSLAQWISPQYEVFVSDVIERYHKGDLALAGEVVRNHDELNNTTSTVEIKTFTGKRKAELELDEQEQRIKRMELENKRLEADLLKDALEFFAPSPNASEVDRIRAESDLLVLKSYYRTIVTGSATAPLALADGRGTEISFALLEQKMGVRLTKVQRQKCGRRMVELMKERYGREYEFPKREEYVDGRVILVNAYWSRDEDLMRKAIKEATN